MPKIKQRSLRAIIFKETMQLLLYSENLELFQLEKCNSILIVITLFPVE